MNKIGMKELGVNEAHYQEVVLPPIFLELGL